MRPTFTRFLRRDYDAIKAKGLEVKSCDGDMKFTPKEIKVFSRYRYKTNTLMHTYIMHIHEYARARTHTRHIQACIYVHSVYSYTYIHMKDT